MKKGILKKIGCFICVITVLIVSTSCNSDYQKRKNAEKALENKRNEQEALKEQAQNDTEPPVITCTMEQANYSVDEKIDYDRLKISLSAEDNVDGNITSEINQISSTVVEHQAGMYKVIYEVIDKAGNRTTFTLPVVIKSKYSSGEEKRLNNCVKAYNKLASALKSPSSLILSNINTDEEGSIVVLNYSAQNGFGAYVKGRIAYFSSTDYILELKENEVPDNFKIGEFVYSYDDIKDFSDYYHSEDK